PLVVATSDRPPLRIDRRPLSCRVAQRARQPRAKIVHLLIAEVTDDLDDGPRAGGVFGVWGLPACLVGSDSGNSGAKGRGNRLEPTDNGSGVHRQLLPIRIRSRHSGKGYVGKTPTWPKRHM